MGDTFRHSSEEVIANAFEALSKLRATRNQIQLCLDRTNLFHTARDPPSTSQSQKECPVEEEQFKLVEEEFTRVMSTHYPVVKILRSKGNTITLKGPNNEVQSGAAKLDELTKEVLEKRIKLPIDLITFIKTSDAIFKYQTHFQSFKNPVSLKVESDLVLSSLSSHSLDDAFQTLLNDLSVEIVKLQGAAAVSPDLDRMKEILIKAKNEANRGKLRVDVSFISEPRKPVVTKVRLVGYSENVNKLKEVLHDYQINQAVIEEELKLPNPDLVYCFHEILDWIDMKQRKVTFKFLHSPNPCVLLSGRRCHVREAKQALMPALATLISDTLVLDGPGAWRYFQADGKVSKELVESSFKVLIRGRKGALLTNVKTEPQSISSIYSITPTSSIIRRWCQTPADMTANKPKLEIKLGSLVDEQVNVLVVPMLGMQLGSTNIGKCLLKKAGNAIRRSFDLMAAKGVVVPGDVLQVDGPPSLGCSKIFFIECQRWDGVNGQSEQALGNGLKRCLDLCVQQGWSSVALPVIGPGVALQYPWRKAFQVLTEKICQFASSSSSGSLSNIHIVIKPDHYSEECYHDVYQHLKLKIQQGGQAIFRSLTSDLDDVVVTVGGGVKLQLVFGDITNETTDAVVNTTDFTNFHTDGTCKNILSVAGPSVEAMLKTATVNQGAVFRTPPGSFPCKAILHVREEKDAGAIEQLACRIIQHCESFGYQSVAIPAISAGADGLDPAILQGIKTATTSSSLLCLTSIRLVLIKINDFLTFKKQIMQTFPPAVINTVPQPLHLLQRSPVSVNPDLSILHSGSSQQSVFLFVGRSRKNVNDALVALKKLYQDHCSTKTFTREDLEDLTQDDVKTLKQLVETEGLYVKEDQPGRGGLTVSGLKDGINQVEQMLHTATPLRKEMRVREEDDLYSRVTWCILGPNGSWDRLPKTANLNLERNNVTKGIVDAQGILWSVDLGKMEAIRRVMGTTTKLKRHEHLSDFTFPLYWDTMADGENLKVVALEPSSAEYRTVEKAFRQTVQQTVLKIERLQNVYLRRTYEARKNHISGKNARHVGAGEKLLYHGTSQETCESIKTNGFNRAFAGKHATSYGQGTYFAVKASYSAHTTYSKVADDGSQAMFVARVLTGCYTQGHSNMRVPPPRHSQQSHDHYDSVVDRTDNPSMYVVFHDNQAYPEYLITFCR
uniref:Poly [ADP-ribose] polymerase n=1 Tax=Stegastes partitus TaxID=144197 RepID=A0A3B4ZIP5_9TELE